MSKSSKEAIKNNNQEIDALIEKLNNLQEDLQKKARKELTKEFIAALKETHNKGQDPYGKKWAPRKNKYSHPILIKSKKMINSYRGYNKGSKDIVITNQASYSEYHNSGTPNLVKRQLIPDESRGLPENWNEILMEYINKLIKDNGLN